MQEFGHQCGKMTRVGMQEWMTLSHFVLLGKNFDVFLAYGTRKIKLNQSGEGVVPTHVVSSCRGE